MTSTWRVVVQPPSEFRVWDDEAVVLVGQTGNTHRLGAAATALWQFMCDQPDVALSADGWLRAFLDDDAVEVGCDDADLPGFEGLLTGLESIGLVARLDH